MPWLWDSSVHQHPLPSDPLRKAKGKAKAKAKAKAATKITTKQDKKLDEKAQFFSKNRRSESRWRSLIPKG